jgi:tetratricopeptide (TPR) repeat protein
LFSCTSTGEEQIELKDAQAYNDRGLVYALKGLLDQAILDFNKAPEIDPTGTLAYRLRSRAYYLKNAYDKSWGQVAKMRELGYQIPSQLIDDLCNASGRE